MKSSVPYKIDDLKSRSVPRTNPFKVLYTTLNNSISDWKIVIYCFCTKINASHDNFYGIM